MTNPSRLYHTLAIILCIAIVASLLPRPTVAYAHEAPVLPGAPSAVKQAVADSLQNANLPDSFAGMTEGLNSEMLTTDKNSSLTPQPSSFSSPLSISKVQSTHYPSGLIDNTVLITYTITNNQLPANLPTMGMMRSDGPFLQPIPWDKRASPFMMVPVVLT